MYRKKDKPYHLDYCFASGDFVKHLKQVEVGDHEFWCKYSDNVPVIVTFDAALYGKSKQKVSKFIRSV
jgi:exodeoxyribonuclease III